MFKQQHPGQERDKLRDVNRSRTDFGLSFGLLLPSHTHRPFIMTDNGCLRVGQQAPDFTATAVVDQEFKEISLSEYRGKYVVLFFYPLDFTFVCPSELIAFDKRYEEFQKRGVEVIGVSQTEIVGVGVVVIVSG